MLFVMSEVRIEAVPGAPKVTWDDLGRPRFVHLCHGSLRDEPLPSGDNGWTADIVFNSVCPSLDCPTCGTHGFWVNGQWRNA